MKKPISWHFIKQVEDSAWGGPDSRGMTRLLKRHGIKSRRVPSIYVGNWLLYVERGKATQAKRVMRQFNYI